MIPWNGLMKTSIQSPQIIYLKIYISNHMILSAIWNDKTNKITGECNLWSLKKLTSAYLFQIAWEKSCDYVLIIWWDSLSLLGRSKAHTSSAKMIYSNPTSAVVHSVKTTTYDQNNGTQWYFHISKAQESSK